MFIVGCAGQEAFRRGETLLAEKQWEASIASLRQAVREEPEKTEYRLGLERAMDKAITTLLSEAALARGKRPDAARELYQRVLLLSPSNERAIDGLAGIEAADRINKLLAEAAKDAKRGRFQEARVKLKKLIDEKPTLTEAREMLSGIDKATGHPESSPLLDARYRIPVSLEFRDAPVRMVFDALAQNSGLNFIFDRDLKQDAKVSIFLRNVPFDDAIEQITASNGLARRVVNRNTILVYQSLPQKIKEYQELTVHSFFVANADVKQLSNMLKAVLKIKDVFVDEKRNLVVIRDTPDVVAMAEKLVAAHDQAEPEVVLDVEIIEFSHSTDNVLGLKFPDQVNFGVASPITVNALRAINGAGVNVTGLDPLLGLNLKRQLGDVTLLANPRIRVRNREKAKFHIGDKVPVITSTTYPGSTTNATTSAVNYLDVGIKLEFEPAVQLDDDVVIKTALEVSSITNTVVTSGTTAYQLGTRNAATVLTLHDNETQVLAGLLSNDETDMANRLPGLGDIPIIGHLFSSHSVKGARKEILLSITPHIVRNLTRPTNDLVEFSFGPEGGRLGGTGLVEASPPATAVSPPKPAPASGVSAPSAAPTVLNNSSIFSSSPLTPSVQAPANAAAGTAPAAGSTASPATPAAPVAPVVEFELPPGVGTPPATGSQ